MASVRGHPFWIHILKHIQNYSRSEGEIDWSPEIVTGPIMLFRMYNKFVQTIKDLKTLRVTAPTVLPTRTFY